MKYDIRVHLRFPVLMFVLVVWFAPPAAAGKKNLKPVPAAGQSIFTASKSLFLVQKTDGFHVGAEMVKNDDAFTVCITIENQKQSAVSIEQERFFLLNAYDRNLYRMPDYELKATWAWFANQPPPPPPPPRRYYTLEATSYGDYTLRDNGWGYYSMSGYSRTYAELEEHYDYSATLGYVIGSTIRHALYRRKARKQIELIDRTYFRNVVLEPGKLTTGCLQFYAINTSNRTPVKLTLFIEDTKFQFVFQE